jgi:energy-coupling factor transporter ATP-binding protein EcfA2
VIADLVSRLAAGTLVGIVGPSGAGKSSILRAGLLPALAAGALPGSQEWRVSLIRPGPHPAAELERVLGAPLEQAVAAHDSDRRLLIAVDQLEEVFTACADEHERRAFLDSLEAAARHRDGAAAVVVASRADFYGRFAPYRGFAELLSRDHVLVPPMERDELARAVELPATRGGLRVERRLVDALVGDVLDEPGALPPLLDDSARALARQRGQDPAL